MDLAIAKKEQRKEYPIPDELKVETYERRRLSADFDRIDLILDLKAGVNGIGAILRGFVDAIPQYDAFVKAIEEKMDQLDELKKLDSKTNRHFLNWDAAWMSLNTKPDEYADYIDLAPQMDRILEMLEDSEDPLERATAETNFLRFKELEEKYTPIYEADLKMRAAKDERDRVRADFLRCTEELHIMHDKERKLAAKIGYDHVVADSKGIFLSDLFPNIRVGQILCTVNGVDVETMKYEDIITIIKETKPPHRTEFRRYDFKIDPMDGSWVGLDRLRELGVLLEDPRIARLDFVAAAAAGNLSVVLKYITDGEDVNSHDHSGCSAFHLAAVHSQREVAEVLLTAGADIDSRDKNKMTPLLSSVRRGDKEFVRWLIDKGADRNSTDCTHRNALFYAIKSGNMDLIKLFLTPITCNYPDTLWGWSPLHVAANYGDLDIIKFLIGSGANIFHRDKKHRIPEEVADESKSKDVFDYLKYLRYSTCGQLVYPIRQSKGGFWIGTPDCLTPKFVSDVNVSHLIIISGGTGQLLLEAGGSIYSEQSLVPKKRVSAPTNAERQLAKFLKELETTHPDMPRQGLWLKSHGAVNKEIKNPPKILQLHEPDIDDDDDSEDSWNALSQHFMEIKHFVGDYIKLCRSEEQGHKGQLVICDATGVSTSAAVLVFSLLVCEQVAVDEGVRLCTEARPVTDISISLIRGLEMMEVALNAKKLKRLSNRVRNSAALSCAF